MKKTGNLFLDDIRIPEDVRWMYNLNEQYINSDWGMVRSYDEFVEFITKNGLPDETSFDYDSACSYIYFLVPIWNGAFDAGGISWLYMETGPYVSWSIHKFDTIYYR